MLDLLGPDTFAVYRDYSLSLAYRPLVQTAADLCAANGVEMPPATVEALAWALVTNKAKPSLYTKDATLNEQLYESIKKSDARAVDVAKSVLTPAQLEFFRQALAARLKPPQ